MSLPLTMTLNLALICNLSLILTLTFRFEEEWLYILPNFEGCGFQLLIIGIMSNTIILTASRFGNPPPVR